MQAAIVESSIKSSFIAVLAENSLYYTHSMVVATIEEMVIYTPRKNSSRLSMFLTTINLAIFIILAMSVFSSRHARNHCQTNCRRAYWWPKLLADCTALGFTSMTYVTIKPRPID